MQLNFDERRILGVLLEKSYATPEQYPLTMNALVTGSNQKSCRNPVATLTEEAVWNALDSLRDKGLVGQVRTMGGRTDRYKHRVTDTFATSGKQNAVLAELLLRGPQTDGELRQRASRLVNIPSLEDLAEVLESLIDRNDLPLARRLSPPGRKRGAKFCHTLYPPGKEPAEEDDDGTEDAPAGAVATGGSRGGGGAKVSELEERVSTLESRVQELERIVQQFTS